MLRPNGGMEDVMENVMRARGTGGGRAGQGRAGQGGGGRGGEEDKVTSRETRSD
jgi:hypothetical protein